MGLWELMDGLHELKIVTESVRRRRSHRMWRSTGDDEFTRIDGHIVIFDSWK